MKYEEQLVNITDKLCECGTMYSLILLNAKSLNITLSGFRCFLDGKYLVCLNIKDTVSVHGGYYEAKNLRFQPYFYNINLNHDIIGMEMYNEMREKYGYPDFRLFRMRTEDFFGIVSISDEEFETASLYYAQAQRNIGTSIDDVMWSCRVRSDIISILHIAEGAYLGKQSGLENEILRYIHDNIGSVITLDKLCTRFNTNRTTLSAIIKEKTGMTPMKYVLETRLDQSRPDLLFTKVPINEIATKYGFADSNYYIRAFKKRFGKSPLQFRNEGFSERIRDEGIYQRRAEAEKTEMSVEDFCEFYKRGLGRAIIRLKKQPDKTPFKAAFSELLFPNKREVYRRLGIYEKEIIDVFEDKEFTAEIATRFLQNLENNEDYGKFTCSIPLLVLLGYRAQAEEIAEKRYKKAYSELLEYTKKPWDGEEYPLCAREFMSAAGTLGRYIKVGDERIKQILFDIADLFDYSDAPVVPTYQNPLYTMWDGVGRMHFFLILDEVIKEHRNGAKLDIRNEFVTAVSDDFKEIAIEDIKSQTAPCLGSSNKSDAETVLWVANALVAEKETDKRLYLLNYFVYGSRPDSDPAEFLIDPTPLIKWAEEEDFTITRKPTVSLMPSILDVLCNMRHPAAREFALKLFFDNSVQEQVRLSAIRMRFGKNYIAEQDKADFTAILRSQNELERNTAIGTFINGITARTPDLPLDMIPYVFARADLHHRIPLCNALAEADLLPEELKTECMYDMYTEIRNLVLKK